MGKIPKILTPLTMFGAFLLFTETPIFFAIGYFVQDPKKAVIYSSWIQVFFALFVGFPIATFLLFSGLLIFSPWRLYPPESYPEKLRSQYFGIKDPSNSIETEVRKIIDGRQEIDEQIKGAAYY